MAVQLSSGEGSYLRVSECKLVTDDWQWPIETRQAAEITQQWHARRASAPAMFNGTVYLFRDYALDAARLFGTLFKTDFKTFLYWRSLPLAPSDPVREASGASIIRSAEGHLLFGRQAPGQLNSGLVYPPTGVIDASDVSGEEIDIDANITRELGEETGLAAADLQRMPGYIVAVTGSYVSIGVEWRSRLPAAELRQRIMQCIGSQSAPELEDIVIVRDVSELEMATPLARLFVQATIGAA